MQNNQFIRKALPCLLAESFFLTYRKLSYFFYERFYTILGNTLVNQDTLVKFKFKSAKASNRNRQSFREESNIKKKTSASDGQY